MGGVDYQFDPRIVAGVFADYDVSSLKGTIQDAVVGLSADIKQKSSWAVGGRIGWLATPEILTYINAGFSSAHFSSGSMACQLAISAAFCSGYTTPSFTANGWFLGGGVESALGGGWFWRNEYRYAYYGSKTIADVNSFSANATPRFNDINFKPSQQTFTTQIVYKFNSGAGFKGNVGSSVVRDKLAANWTGFNVYGGVGYGHWTADETSSSVPNNNGEPPLINGPREGGKGWLGRVGAGYDYQFSRVVVGAFADFDISHLRGTISQQANLLAGDISQQWSWAAGGRAGLIVTPHLLGYLNGGYAQAHFSSSTMSDVESPNFFWGAPGVQATTPSFSRSGWFVGGGTEYAMTSLLGVAMPSGLFWRNEYRYANYGNQSLAPTLNSTALVICGGCSINSINFKPTVQTVTTELVYKFGAVR